MTTTANDYDPNAAGTGDDIFGLPKRPDESRIQLLAVPFEATCSYGVGTALGPESIARASTQVDLLDPDFGNVHEIGIHLHRTTPELQAWNEEARQLAAPVIAAGGVMPNDSSPTTQRVDELSRLRTDLVETWTQAQLARACVPGIIGGDHSCPLGAFAAISEQGPISILHVDAHHDLRERYEGFAESHASIMHNALRLPGIERIVQVGIRDYCQEERSAAAASPRVATFYWHDWREAMMEGTAFSTLAKRAIDQLTDRVWVSFDIDGLDPRLCPGTGTPVPGGPSFDHAAHLLGVLKRSGRSVCGFDLCEVGSGEWDGNVGARILYKLCGVVR